MISFTIDGASYQAEDGMTWEEWANSSYNTDGCFWITLTDTDNVAVSGLPLSGDCLVSKGSTHYSGHIVSEVGMNYVEKSEIILDSSVNLEGYKTYSYYPD